MVQGELLQPDDEGGTTSEGVMLRLEEIRREVLLTLMEMAGEGQPYSP